MAPDRAGGLWNIGCVLLFGLVKPHKLRWCCFRKRCVSFFEISEIIGIIFFVNPGSWMIHAWDSLWCWWFSWRSRITGVFQVTSSSKKLRTNSTVTIGSDAVFPGRSLFLYSQHVSHGRFQNQIAGWFGSIVPGRFNIFFEYVYPMLGPHWCNHGIFCKNIRISRPSLNSRWWQLKYF